MTVPWSKVGAAAQEFNQRGDVKDHVLGGPILHRFAINHCADAQLIRIGDLVARDEARSEWTKRIKRFPAAPLAPSKILFANRGRSHRCHNCSLEHNRVHVPRATFLHRFPITTASSHSKST